MEEMKRKGDYQLPAPLTFSARTSGESKPPPGIGGTRSPELQIVRSKWEIMKAVPKSLPFPPKTKTKNRKPKTKKKTENRKQPLPRLDPDGLGALVPLFLAEIHLHPRI
jgi:hypothetical protein